MDRFDRIFSLHKILGSRQTPIPARELAERMECSTATVKRTVRDMRDYLNAPIEAFRGRGYRYATDAQEWCELPGLWLSAAELRSLLGLYRMVEQLVPDGLLSRELDSVREHIEVMLHRRGDDPAVELERVQLMAARWRRVPPECFVAAVDAVLRRRQLAIEYRPDGDDSYRPHTVSPQLMLFYRGGWYLVATGHGAGRVGTYPLERMRRLRQNGQRALDMEPRALLKQFHRGYGLSLGEPVAVAVLRFSGGEAESVAAQSWHPEQSGRYLDDGRFELRLPYSRRAELVRDVLACGPDVEVIAPDSLRREVARRHAEAAAVY